MTWRKCWYCTRLYSQRVLLTTKLESLGRNHCCFFKFYFFPRFLGVFCLFLEGQVFPVLRGFFLFVCLFFLSFVLAFFEGFLGFGCGFFVLFCFGGLFKFLWGDRLLSLVDCWHFICFYLFGFVLFLFLKFVFLWN